MRIESRLIAAAVGLAMSAAAYGQDYAIDWSTLDAGGGTSTGGLYQLTGTIGQPDASVTGLTGGPYSLEGGFWPGMILPSAGEVPSLVIQAGPAGILISWPTDAVGYVLEETGDLSSGQWVPSAAANGASFSQTAQTRFYRLSR